MHKRKIVKLAGICTCVYVRVYGPWHNTTTRGATNQPHAHLLIYKRKTCCIYPVRKSVHTPLRIFPIAGVGAHRQCSLGGDSLLPSIWRRSGGGSPIGRWMQVGSRSEECGGLRFTKQQKETEEALPPWHTVCGVCVDQVCTSFLQLRRSVHLRTYCSRGVAS